MDYDPHDTVFPLPVYFVLAVLFLFGCPSVNAEPLFQTQTQDVVITLHSEKCELKEVSNLKQKATWEEKGKVFQGCWGYRDGLVIFYFLEDRTVGIIPAQAFEKVIGV